MGKHYPSPNETNGFQGCINHEVQIVNWNAGILEAESA